MEKRNRTESGLLSLEASIALTIFIFLMLFVYSFFAVFEARNDIAHVVLSTANSLALDAFENTTVGESGNISQVIYNIYGSKTNENSPFTDYRQWYDVVEVEEGEDEAKTKEKAKKQKTLFDEVIKDRFLAYLTDGDVAQADAIMKRYHVVGGKDGLDFSGSYVDEKNRLHVVVRYTLEYEFNMFGLGTIDMEQSACSKLWKD